MHITEQHPWQVFAAPAGAAAAVGKPRCSPSRWWRQIVTRKTYEGMRRPAAALRHPEAHVGPGNRRRAFSCSDMVCGSSLMTAYEHLPLWAGTCVWQLHTEHPASVPGIQNRTTGWVGGRPEVKKDYYTGIRRGTRNVDDQGLILLTRQSCTRRISLGGSGLLPFSPHLFAFFYGQVKVTLRGEERRRERDREVRERKGWEGCTAVGGKVSEVERGKAESLSPTLLCSGCLAVLVVCRHCRHAHHALTPRPTSTSPQHLVTSVSHLPFP